MNIVKTGQNFSQPTKVSNIRYELAVFHGYTFERTSNAVIEVWQPAKCDCCDADVRTSSQFVRTGAADDADVQRHGLRKFHGAKPIRGLKLHSESPIYCEPCKDRWLKGEALEKIDASKS